MVTLEDAYAWLHVFDESQLSPSSRFLLGHLKEAIQKEQYSEAWKTLERLKNVSQKIPNELEVAEILLECGRAAYQMGHWEEAAHLLRSAADHYKTRPHLHNVARWMLGYVQWSVPALHEAGLVAWQECLTDFEELAGKRTLTSKDAAWYKSRWNEMRESLECALRDDCLPPTLPVREEGVNSDPPARKPGEPTAYLRLFPVSEEIPAGGFGPAGVDPFPFGYVDVDQLLIGGRPYRITSLRKDRLINITGFRSYFVVKVIGDSMNLEGIEEGDYVLLRNQNVAESSDIVAAEISDVDNCATLKRLVIRDGKLILQPRSSNLDHKEFIFAANGKGFTIRGVAVAVLKPV